MKKLTITSILALCMACPAMADIAKNAQSATCDSSTIGTTTGPANLQADWTANTIHLDWYSNDTKQTSTTCSYDGTITLPSTPQVPTGYTFGGWKVRAAAPSQPQQTLDCSIYTPEDDSYVYERYEEYQAECESHSGCVFASVYNENVDDIQYQCRNRVETQYNNCTEARTAEECANVTDDIGNKPCLWHGSSCYMWYCRDAITDDWCTGGCYWDSSYCVAD